jgi:hypothetical protein
MEANIILGILAFVVITLAVGKFYTENESPKHSH